MDELLNNIIEWGKRQAAIRAMILTGSYGGGQPKDKLSDLDVAIFGDGLEAYVSDQAWMQELGEVWVWIPEKTPEGHPTRLVIFSRGRKADFSFLPMEVLEELVSQRALPQLYDQGFRVLVDKAGIAERLPPPRGRHHPMPKPTENDFVSVVREFWFEAWHVARHLYRQDLWHGKFRDWTTKGLLLKMIEWHARSRHDWNYDTRYLGVDMRRWLDGKTWQQLHQTFGRFDAEDSWQALEATTTLFSELAGEVARDLGYRYPQDVEDNVRSFGRDLCKESGEETSS